MTAIKNATVVGSGVMGAQIAAQLANCGIPVLLLDLPEKTGKDRSQLARRAIAGLKKIKPSPLYSTSALDLISAGNLEDDLARAGSTDWIIEAIVEKAEPKISLFEKLQKHMGPRTILSTNTSGIPLSTLSQKLKPETRRRFLATHFFNPPRYLRLVEIIKGPETSPETVDAVKSVLKNKLNKVPVPAQDVPCFIANRIGVHAMVNTLRLTREFDLTIEEVDQLTGSLMGRPKTGTYRLADLVGLDTLGHIINNLRESLPGEEGAVFTLDPLVEKLIEGQQFGRKSGAGFYKKTDKAILGLDFESGGYRDAPKTRFEELSPCFKEETLTGRLKKLFTLSGRGADAARAILSETLAYAAGVAPVVSENLADVDRAMELGFAWEAGPFKVMDAIGLDVLKSEWQKRDVPCPEWLEGSAPFYSWEEGGNPTVRSYRPDEREPYSALGIEIARLRQTSAPLFTTTAATLWDLGDEICLLEFHSKMNAQDLVSLQAIHDGIARAEADFKGLVIGNQGPHFCAGANIGMVLMDAINGEFENVEFAIKQFQTACMAIKYASVPVVVSPHSMALGGGCEFVLHCNRPVLSPETYLGLVEVGVGILPAGGGTKELTLRASEEPGVYLKNLVKKFEAIATAKVSTSAVEAFELGYLDKRAVVASNESTRLDQAKAEALGMAAAGYRPPPPALSIPVLGADAMAAFETGIYLMQEAGYASAHDGIIARAVGRIMSGGSVSAGQTVDEQYLLDLEREEFLKLVGMKKSQERIEHMLKKGKPLRN